MKELENIVHDLEYAKKLEKLGVKQDSLFYYRYDSLSEKLRSIPKIKIVDNNNNRAYITERYVFYSAFTTTELLEMLPKFRLEDIRGCEMEHSLIIQTSSINGFNISYQETTKYGLHYSQLTMDKKLSNALAKMLIYLIENKLIELK